MNKRQLLFVTYRDEHLDEGLSYAIELAKAMMEDIVLLLVTKRDLIKDRFHDLMSGVAFAEEGEHDTALALASGRGRDLTGVVDGKITEMILSASKAGVHLEVRVSDLDVVKGIRSYLKGNTIVDKVVLSPAVTESEALTTRDLNRLVRTASRPIVTMTKQSVQPRNDAPRAERDRSSRHEPAVSY